MVANLRRATSNFQQFKFTLFGSSHSSQSRGSVGGVLVNPCAAIVRLQKCGSRGFERVNLTPVEQPGEVAGRSIVSVLLVTSFEEGQLLGVSVESIGSVVKSQLRMSASLFDTSTAILGGLPNH
jgi:hypothetical protein